MADSALLYLSTEHAKHRDASTGKYTFNIGNTIYIEKSVRIVPTSITLPNIFPNVNAYRNTWSEPSGAVVIPIGQYSTTTLATAATTASTDFTVTINADGYFDFACTGTNSVASLTIDVFEMFGFQDQVQFLAGAYQLPVTTNLTATSYPNLGGEKMILLSCDKIGSSNLIFGADGTPYDIFANVSFHDVDYGYTAQFKAADSTLEDIVYKHHNNLDTMMVEILDSKMRHLVMPSNYHLRMIFKVFHQDNTQKYQR